jgi:hypothetical protein
VDSGSSTFSNWYLVCSFLVRIADETMMLSRQRCSAMGREVARYRLVTMTEAYLLLVRLLFGIDRIETRTLIDMRSQGQEETVTQR